MKELQTMIDKQLEGVRERSVRSNALVPRSLRTQPSLDCDAMLKTIDQYQRLGKWVQHDPPTCDKWRSDAAEMWFDDLFDCTCGLSAELDKIQKELKP